ncbi:hypothetical protein [Arsukibacterium sp.]|uniref:hypothetical protein n=1 Tax=Arsukibacterium sp. TaxID=1977258 RepID=UPI003567DC38
MRSFLLIVSIMLGSLVLWYVFGIVVPIGLLDFDIPGSDRLSLLSSLGSMFGGANALFSSVALFMIMMSVWLQKEELQATRTEIKAATVAQQEIAEIQKKAIALQVIMPFMDQISSENMRSSIVYLADFHRGRNDFAEFYRELLDKRKQSQLSTVEKEKLNEIDSARRNFVMIFHRMIKLHKTKVVDDEVVKVVIGPDHVWLLKHIVEPLEKSIRDNYSKSIFNFAYSLYTEEEIELLGKH